MKRRRLKNGVDHSEGNGRTERAPAPSTPDRKPPTHMWVGPRSAFNGAKLADLPGLNRVHDNTWIAVFVGRGYKDMDVGTTKSIMSQMVQTFVSSYPDMEVAWLEVKKKEKAPKLSAIKAPPVVKPKAKRTFSRKEWHKATKGRQYRV